MTDHEHNELFAALMELAKRYPHWRVGQLVTNVAGWTDTEVWEADYGDLLAAAKAHLNQLAVTDVTIPNSAHPLAAS